MIKSSNFHPMRGHVRQGNSIQFPSGLTLKIRSASDGWILDKDDQFYSGPHDGAYALLEEIVKIENEQEIWDISVQPGKSFTCP